MSRVNHPGTRERESGASGAKSLEDRHNRVRCENRKSAVGEDGAGNFVAAGRRVIPRRLPAASLSFPRNLMRRSDDSSPRGWNTLRGQKRST